MSVTHSDTAIPREIVQRLRQAQRVVVLTGAGISAESGVPTFRDAQTGLWASYDPHELATPKAFMQNPKLVWDWYAWRRSLVAEVTPNAGHYALAAIEQRVPHFTLITQNVDGLHEKAGSHAIVELHGNIFRVKCFTEDKQVAHWDDSDEKSPPRCQNCGGYLRPDVVWFGETLPVDALARAVKASQSADFFLVVGTSAMVQPAASLPFEAIEMGAMVVEVNPERTPLSSYMAHTLRGAAGIILPALVGATWNDQA